MDKICCLFNGESAARALKDWDCEIAEVINDPYVETRILYRCKKCGGLVLYDHDETSYFVPGEDWDNAYVEKRYYPVLEEDIRVESGKMEFDWAALTSRKHIAASYRELDTGEPPYRYVEAEKPGKKALSKKFTLECPVTLTIKSLPAPQQQVEDARTFVELCQLDSKRGLKVELPNHDDPQEIWVEYCEDGYRLELIFPMGDFGWRHPLVLAGDGLGYKAIVRVLNVILLDGINTDEIPVVMESLKDVTASVFGEKYEPPKALE